MPLAGERRSAEACNSRPPQDWVEASLESGLEGEVLARRRLAAGRSASLDATLAAPAVTTELTGKLYAVLLGEAQHDPQIRAELHERLITPRRTASARVVREAQARGLLRDDVSVSTTLDLFYGPIFHRMLSGHEPNTGRFATQVFVLVLEALKPIDETRKGKRS